MSATIAVDAMGGDRAPDEIVAGAIQAADELGVRVLLVGRPESVEPLVGPDVSRVEVVAASEVVEMHEPASSVRRKKDASVVQCAQLVRDGKADAMVGAGNTGATMAAALLRMGRVRGIARPAIAAPIPVPGHGGQILVDAGSTVDCAAEWLVQFAFMGRAYARVRLGVAEPTVGLLSNGEEPSKGDSLRKEVSALLSSEPWFVGNVEGRDLLHPGVDVVLTDGFSGNIALKAIEGSIKAMIGLILGVLESTPETREASKIILPPLLEAAKQVDPDYVGGSLLLGVQGVCVIAHGSSGALAIRNAIERALEAVDADVVGQVKEAVPHAG
ncbi:MAG: phosphate acyltransferase PlsX [Acidimicrobiia bacterium]